MTRAPNRNLPRLRFATSLNRRVATRRASFDSFVTPINIPRATPWVVALIGLLAACTSAPQGDGRGAPDAGPPTPGLDTFPPRDPRMPAVGQEEKQILLELRAIEAAFARRNCAVIREHARRLEALRARARQSLPVSTSVALAVCEAEAAPQDRARAQSAIEALDMAVRNLPPVVDRAFLEELRAERFLAIGDRENALKARRAARAHVLAQDSKAIALDAQILELSDGLGGLSEAQKARFKEAMILAQKDDRLFASVALFDEILAQLAAGPARAAVLEQRTKVVTRIEQLFLMEAAQVEEKRASGRDAEAREQAVAMRARFPARPYQARIDALLGVAPDANAAPGGAGAPAEAPGAAGVPGAPGALTTDPNAPPAASPMAVPGAVDALTADKALADARAALDSGNPAGAVDVLDALPESVRTDRTRRLRREAAEAHVRELRMRVRDIYNRAGAQPSGPAKLDALRQAKSLLETILSRYPDTPGRSGIERNLRTINQDIEEIGKGKK